MEIGRNIKILRQKNGLTQEALAERLGITYQAVSKWETDANTPDIAFLPELAEIFGTSIDALFKGETMVLPESDIIKDDDVIRIVQLQGKRIISVTGERDKPIEIMFPRNCNNETQYFKVEIYGHVIADGSINGNVICHQYVDCADINGNVISEQSVDCADVAGNIKAGHNVDCGGVAGNITAGQNVDCGGVCGNVSCQGDISAGTISGAVECSGNIKAETVTAKQIKCSGDINCDKIEYAK